MAKPRQEEFYAVGKYAPIDLDDEEIQHNAVVQDQDVRAFRYHVQQRTNVSGAESASVDLTEDGEELGDIYAHVCSRRRLHLNTQPAQNPI